MKGKLYFVHGYYSSYDGNEQIIENNEIIRDRIILMRNDINNVYKVEIEDVSIYDQKYLPLTGEYVIYDGNIIESANNNPTAQMYNILGESLRYRIINSDLYVDINKEERNITKAMDVRSFHINVGHGNCSIIIFKESEDYEAWMVDCSVKEIKTSHNYLSNLKKCFDYLKREYNITRISKLLITHPHYDHINGIHYLINRSMIDSETEVWFDLNLPWNSKTCINLLSRLMHINVKFVNPIVSNSTSNIRILYPETSYNAITSIPKKHLNNASVVYQISFNGISMVFPGDIELEGWNLVKCSPYLDSSTYYCISHHGSINGHIRNICMNKASISSVADCIKSSEKQILMGKNGIFSGIFSRKVLADFAGTLERTDQVSSYIELDWMSGIIKRV